MKSSARRALLRVIGLVSIVVNGYVTAAATNVVPLPALSAGTVEMRVAYVVNPRLPRMNEAQLQILLESTRDAVREHFRVDLRFSQPEELRIEGLFDRIPAARTKIALNQVYDFKAGKGDPDRLAKAFASGLKVSGEPLPALIEFSRAHIPKLKNASYAALGAALSQLQLQQIDHWTTMKALDGGPVIDARPYNEYPMWLALGYADIPFELVLTNQIIASVEYVFPSVHSAIRGGYSNGLTTYSRSSRFGTMSVWSTFAFTSDNDWLKQMRDGETYDAQEAARLAGVGAAHEIGHQLFHFVHPFGQSACVMNPVSMFAYRAWADKLSAKDCPIGSSPAMKPGAYQFHY